MLGFRSRVRQFSAKALECARQGSRADVRLCRSARSHYLRQPTLQPCHEYQKFRSEYKPLKNKGILVRKIPARNLLLILQLGQGRGERSAVQRSLLSL